MLKTLNKAMQYSPRGTSKFRRPSRVRMGWMFPVLAIVSLFMNGSIHFRRTRGVSEIEHGPRATNVPGDQARRMEEEISKPSQNKIKLAETIRRQVLAAQAANEEQQLQQQQQVSVSSKAKKKKTRPKKLKVDNVVASRTKVKALKKKKKKAKASKASSGITLKKTKTTKASGKQPSTPAKESDVGSKPKLVDTGLIASAAAGSNTDTDATATATGVTTSDAAAAIPTKTTTETSARSAAVPKRKARSVTPEALSPNVTFSACLLVRDDNDIMDEWIAYHYHVLKMRRLIVAVDPHSETSPSSLLKNWKDLIEIDLWTDDKYMPKEFLQMGQPPKKYMENITKFGAITEEENISINSHRYRQKMFLGRCLKKIKMEKRTWAVHIDTDEYIVPNKLFRKEHADSIELPPVKESGAILNLVQQLVKADAKVIAYPCITMLRLLFGSVESNEDDWSLSMPSGFSRQSFETLRWRHHGAPKDKKMHGHPKVMMDVSRVPRKYFADGMVYSIHRPFKKLCRGHGESKYGNFDKYPITANHYLGSWERYNARNDTRRSWSVYNDKATVSSGQDNWVEGWLEGFISDVGEEQASRLLRQHFLKSKSAAKL